MKRLLMAFKAFWLVLKGEELLNKPIAPESSKKVEIPEKVVQQKSEVADFENGAIYTLVLLQREGRLIDFLQERIDDYTDEQIGTAVRQVHKNCNNVLNTYYQVSPVLEGTEGGEVAFEKKFDPSTIKLSGKLPVSPPFRGTLKHKGWKVSKLHFPSRSDVINPHIIHSAEVEVN